MLGIQKVTDPEKVVTDEFVLKNLAKQGINKDYVELWHDYAPRSKGKEYSPYARFYKDRKSNKRVMVTSILPHIKAMGHPIECGWLYAKGKYYSRANLFSAIVEGTQIKVTALSDQPTGAKLNDYVTWNPQLFFNNAEISPIPEEARLLETDPMNSNYHQNVLEWDYGICKRRIRIIEGRIRDRITLTADPHGEVRVANNVIGNMRLRFGSREADGMPIGRVEGDVEIISKEELDKAKYPITIGASPETFYPAAGENSPVDGYVREFYLAGAGIAWDTIQSNPGNNSSDTVANAWAAFIHSDSGNGEYRQLIRGIFLLDTEPLPDTCTITDAVFSLKIQNKTDTFGIAATFNIYSSNPASNDVLVNGDYATLGTNAYATAIAYGDLAAVESYQDWTFIQAGKDAVSKTALTKLGLREATYDAPDNPPVWVASKQIGFSPYYADQGNTSDDPKLVVTYTSLDIIEGSASGSGVGLASSSARLDVIAQALGNGIGLSRVTSHLIIPASASGRGIGRAEAIAKLIVLAEAIGHGMGIGQTTRAIRLLLNMIKPPVPHTLGRTKSIPYNLGQSLVKYTLGRKRR